MIRESRRNMNDKRNIKALVVDDDKVVRDFFVRFLSLENVEVKCAGDGPGAIEAAKADKFDIVFLDVMMPKMGGLETFRELKKTQPGIKCVMVTGYASDESLEELKKEGAVDSIHKPLDLGQIDSLLKEYTNLSAKKISIMVVDDEEVVLSFFKRLFQDSIYEITLLKKGRAALEAVSQRSFDIVFIDIELPDMNGVDLYMKVREMKPEIRFMLITGDPSRCDGIEHFGCLYKPFEIAKIYWEIEKIKSLRGLSN